MIQTETARNEYTVTVPSLRTYPYTFQILDKSEIEVLVGVADATLDTDYTVSGVGDEAGGEITFTTDLVMGALITFIRKVPATQLVDLNEGQPFDAEINETEYDRLTMMLQQVRETLARALKFSPWSRKKNINVPEPITGQVLAWDSSGNLVNQTGGTDGRAFVWRGPWNSGTAYAIDDVVSYQGSSYIAILASTGVIPTMTSTWQLLAQKGADGGSGGVTMSDATPAADAASGTPGVSTNASRGDHQHAHPNTGSFLADAHHPKSHDHAGSDGSGTVVHASLGSIGADDHHPQIHGLVSGNHTVSGLTTGDVLTALSATTFGFQTPSGGGGGSGDVVGPGSAVNGNVVLFDGTTGKLIKDGGAPAIANRSNINPLTASYIKDDFVTGANTSNNVGELRWVLTGSGSVSQVISRANHPGVLLVTAAGSNKIALALKGTGGSPVRFADNWDSYWILTPEAVTALTLRFGLWLYTQSETADPPTNGIFFERLSTDTNYFAVTRAASSQTRIDMGLAAVGSLTTYVNFRLRRKDASTIAFSVNGGAEQTQTLTIPTGDAMPVLEVIATTASAQNIDIDFFDNLITGLVR